MSKRVFLIEDEEGVREVVKIALETYGYKVSEFLKAEDAVAALSEGLPDLFIFDIILPGMDGITATKLIRSNDVYDNVPILLLTARSEEIDKVLGLESGADDYLTKPFGMMELTARVKALIRRAEKRSSGIQDCYRCGSIELRLSTREVSVKGVPVELTLKEFELLKFIMLNSDRVVSRDEIAAEIWNSECLSESRTLDMHIRSIRQKLGDDADNPRYIKTVRGVGYRFIVE